MLRTVTAGVAVLCALVAGVGAQNPPVTDIRVRIDTEHGAIVLALALGYASLTRRT